MGRKMSERKKEHSLKWGVPLEEVAGKVSGTLVDYPDFKTAELHANIKRGMEVPLSGVASMPDVIRKVIDLRTQQNERAQNWIQQVHKIVNDGENMTEEEKMSAIMTAEWDVRRQSFSPRQRMRLEFAETVLSSITDHLLTETAAVDGARGNQSVEMVKALVLHDENTMEKLFSEKKRRRTMRHPLGGE